MKKSAFTLIELLVVISIIDLLVAILMPALNKAKQLATGAVCLNNEANLAKAWVMYNSENDDKMCSSVVWGNWSMTQPHIKAPSFVYSPIGAGHEGELEGIRQRGLWPYAPEVELYNCPGDKRAQKNPTGFGFRTYSQPAGLAGDLWGGNLTEIVTKADQIPHPSDKYIFVEETENGNPGWNRGSWITGIATYQWVDSVAIWHNNASTFGFADGHAERISWQDDRTIETCMREISNGLAIPFNPPNPDLNWLILHWPTGEDSPNLKF